MKMAQTEPQPSPKGINHNPTLNNHIMKAFSIYDSKADSFGFPVPFVSEGAAIRTFGDSVNKPDTIHNLHPEDFSLFHVGEFDESSGMFLPEKSPRSVVSAIQLKN